MKLLKPAPYYFPERVSSTHLTDDLEEAYEKAGFETVFYVPTPTRGITAEEREKYKKIKYEERCGGLVKIYRFAMFGEPKNALMRAIRYTLVQFKQYFKSIKEKDIDIVSAGSTPPTQGILSVKIKKKLSKKYGKNVPFVYNLQDVFPDSLVSAGICGKHSFLYKIGNKIADYTYENSDKIIVISEDFKRMLLEKGIPENKIELIYNWVDENEVVYIDREKNTLFDEYGLDRNKFYFTYSGNIGLNQNMNMLADAAEKLGDREDIGFVLIGDGSYAETLKASVKERGIKNITFIPFQPYERISEVFSIGDVGLIISKPGTGISSVPSKTWSYMSAKRPILASFDLSSELCRIITENDCGECADAGDMEAFIKAVLKMVETKDKNKEQGENGRAFVTKNISKNVCTDKYVRVYESIQEYENNSDKVGLDK